MRKHLHISRKFGCGGVHKHLLHLALHHHHLGNLIGSGSPAVLKQGGKMVGLSHNLEKLNIRNTHNKSSGKSINQIGGKIKKPLSFKI